MSMSIGTFLTTVGSIIAGPIGTGIGNIAAVSNLGVSIATKIDTSKIRSDVGGIRTDIRSLDRDIATLACDIDDMRSENAWNVATTGRCPISVNRGEASYNTQLIQTNTNTPQTNTNTPQQQDDSSDEKLNQIANMLGAIIQQNQSQQVAPPTPPAPPMNATVNVGVPSTSQNVEKVATSSEDKLDQMINMMGALINKINVTPVDTESAPTAPASTATGVEKEELPADTIGG